MISDEAANGATAGETHARLCPMCETGRLIARQCKLICESCGYMESCEDNFVPNLLNPPDAALHRQPRTS